MNFEKEIKDIEELLYKIDKSEAIEEAIVFHKEAMEKIKNCENFILSAKQKIEEYKKEL